MTMNKFNLIKNSNEFDEAYFEKDIEKMNKLYYKMSSRFEYLLEDLNEKNLIDIDELKNFISTRYSYTNMDSFYDLIEEYKKFYKNELPFEKIDY